MLRNLSLSSVRLLSPADFRQWAIGGISLTVLGYAVITTLSIAQAGVHNAYVPRLSVATCVCLLALLLAVRGRELAGGVLAITVVWIEVQLGFLTNPLFPSPGMLVLPVLVTGIGLLLGTRIALVATVVTIICATVTQYRGALMVAGLTAVSVFWFVMFAIAMVAAWALLSLSLAGFTRMFHEMTASNAERVQADARRQEMETQLAHAQRLEAVGQLAGGLSHDFNNILTAVSGSADLLRAEDDPVEREALLDEIVAARDRGAALTQQLLAFARREVIQPRVIDVAEHIFGMQRLLQRVAGDRVRVVFALTQHCRVRVDPGQFEQSLVNLLSNARDAMPDGGDCTIAVDVLPSTPDGDRIRVCVTDTGTGMTDAVAARAFEPFFTTKSRGQGTGLGLAAVHGMVLQSGGDVRIVSERGRGTRVTIELPRVDEPAFIRPAAAAVPGAPTGSATILVAEDDDGTRRIVDRILRRAGYRVLLAVDGLDAWQTLTTGDTSVDLLLTDVMMPGLTGPALAVRVRERMPLLPVVFMTGYAEEHVRTLGTERLEGEVVTKPFSGDALTTRIAAVLHASVTNRVAHA